ncbi:hypothetical protein I3760_14G031500 [Carya illinoinensis]|uniref:Myb-like domain-containing protein n=1 Tax=Carya illinoinensis TaxID=32201 RepID=A0A8T1NID6_CARIL|nr:trihelix transcription factor PTL-like [Carya illinoinensis]KAG2669370.1 hypothetical protein I3760_14G031500 [Carya illinoinensis]KAG2669371.1 hypothetical protein I3760_14G031500 [Carya illinoinensis]KAG2669372.1 hypothetical protein I3760_14G031500 [Carya illinoinensis]KAG6628663.1 hypothetical protein CIPAW_14G028700 [Carya illinoinensis]KAG6628664.1 hypothetical protein CIPAW_14G028700 [Carya illinoinensis]
MDDQYHGLLDFRHFMAGRNRFPAVTQPTGEPFFLQKNVAPTQLQYEAIMVGTEAFPRGLVGFSHDSMTSTTVSPTTASTASLAATLSGSVQMESSGWMGSYDAGNSTRWPRQETLTLLEIRSRLDSKFKETNQKGPLWDEVSRLMAEEGYLQRSGKKCKEKFENLYKYYKKTKEGKAGRQGGKHYRFFRQLEAIYGEGSKCNNHASISDHTHLARNSSLPCHDQNPNNVTNREILQNQMLCKSLSFSNSSEFETSSSENNDDDLSAIAFMMNQSKEEKKVINERQGFTRNKRSWKAKLEEFVDAQMRKMMDAQEAWMVRMLENIERREQESLSKEEEWRKQEAIQFDQEVHDICTQNRAWIEARDAAIMEALKKCIGKELQVSLSADLMADVETQSHKETQDERRKEIPFRTVNNSRWTEMEVSSLIQLRTSLELRFQEGGRYLEESLWEEIAARMGSLDFDRSAVDCKEKWENISIFYNKTMDYCNEKREDHQDLNWRTRAGGYFDQQQPSSFLDQETCRQRPPESMGVLQLMNESGTDLPASSSSSVGPDVHPHGFYHGGEKVWQKYGVRSINSKGKRQQV